MFTLLQQNFNSQLYYSFTILLVVLREFVTVLTRYTPIADLLNQARIRYCLM